jgi:hypothetical protein
MKTRFAVTLAASTALASAAFAQPDHPGVYRATPLDPGQRIPVGPGPTDGPGFDMTWNTIDNSGGPLQGGSYLLDGTVGQPDAGLMTGNGFELMGGYWALTEAAPCYANCDSSSVAPVLNANDFQCFLNAFAQNLPYANCDNSTVAPVLNANDFQCFMNSFAIGCS